MKVLIRGPLLSQSGYGVHSRQVFKWLLSKGYDITCQVLPWGITPWYLNKDALDGLIGEIMSRTGQPSGQFDCSFQIQLPDEWDTSLAKKNFGVTAAVETNFCNPTWVQACNQMDGVIVPSKFTAGVLRNSGKIIKPLTVIPESFPSAFEKDLKETKVLKTKSKRNFLLFGQLTAPNSDLDRKNTFNAIKWFCEKFEGRKDVGLIVKTNMGTNSTIDKRISTKTLKKLIEKVRPGNFPKVHLLHGHMTDEDLFDLYNDSSLIGLISATRGEGYGLPMIEAAASGLPVIATDWSGHKTFLQDGSWIPVKYELKQVVDQRVDNRIFMARSMWADPSEESFKNGLQKLYNERNVYREKCKKSRNKIVDKFSETSLQKEYDKFLEENL